jgi:hypothetical protein
LLSDIPPKADRAARLPRLLMNKVVIASDRLGQMTAEQPKGPQRITPDIVTHPRLQQQYKIDFTARIAAVDLLPIFFWLGIGLIIGAVLSFGGWQLALILGLSFAAFAIVRAALDR